MSVSSITPAPSPLTSPLAMPSPSPPVKSLGTGGTMSVEDSVSLSELGRSLRGDSLVAFEALSDKQRAQLVGLVDSGKITGEEVHDALKQRLKQARSSAVAATDRMFEIDHADLLRNEATSADDLRSALGSTLAKRSSLMDKLASAMSEGDRAATSDALAARTQGPLPFADRLNMNRLIMPGFFGTDFTDSRLNYTKKEGDAAYKLKSLGVSLDGIDGALRGIGEKDAAAILSERAGLPSSRTVEKDSEFSLEDAAIKPLIAGPSGGESLPDRRAWLRALGPILSSAKPGAVYRFDVPKDHGINRSNPAQITEAAGSAQSAVSVDYVRGLIPHY